MRKAIWIVVAVLIFAGAFIAVSIWAGRSLRELRSGPQISADVLGKPWVDQSLSDTVAFVSPWPLEKASLDLGSVARVVTSQNTMQHEQDGLSVMASHIVYVNGTHVNLDGAAEGAIANLRRKAGNDNVTSNKFDTWIIGAKALEVSAKVEQIGSAPALFHGIIFSDGPELYEVIMVCRADAERADAVWDKLRSSIKKRA